MIIKNIEIHRLVLSPELKQRGYCRPDLSAINLIRDLGFLSPCIVVKVDKNTFEILAGEENWFAAQSLGIQSVPVKIVSPKDDSEKLAYVDSGLEENPISRARRFQAWLDSDPKRSKTQLAEIEHCTRSSISHQIRLLSLEDGIIELLETGKLKSAHGRELLKIGAGQGRVQLADQAAQNNWSVSQLRSKLSGGAPPTRSTIVEPPETKDADMRRLENRLTELIGSTVTVEIETGELKIDYRKNYDVLDGILTKLGYTA